MDNLPKHVAIIPDGNRRWAKKRGLPSVEGHRKGYERTKSLARLSHKLGIKVFTIWGFSTENWKRDEREVGHLMEMFYHGVNETLPEAIEDQVRLIHIGRRDRLSDKLKAKIIEAESKTKHFTERFLVVGLDYGGRDEIIRAINRAKEAGASISTESDFEHFLDTHDLPYPNPDLIIRTSGEYRVSGLLPWQATYSEFAFLEQDYPDLSDELFEKTLNEYSERNRRFGK